MFPTRISSERLQAIDCLVVSIASVPSRLELAAHVAVSCGLPPERARYLLSLHSPGVQVTGILCMSSIQCLPPAVVVQLR